MEEGQDDLIEELQDSTGRFLEQELSNEALQGFYHTGSTDRPLWEKASAMGWFQLILPEEHDGLGLSLPQMGFLFHQLGRHPFPGPVLEHAVVAPQVAVAASPPQRERLLACLGGERLLAFADPNIDVEQDRRPSTPELADGRIDGRVHLVRAGFRTDELLLVGSSGRRPVIALVDIDRTGVLLEPTTSVDPGGRHLTVVLDGVRIDESDVVAWGDDAARLLRRLRAGMQLMMACELAGLAARMLQLSIEHATARQQFKRPIGSFQAVKHLIADMEVHADSLSNLCRATLDEVAHDHARLEHEALVAKAYGARVGRAIAESSLQVHGGIGFTMEHVLHIFLKRTLALQGAYGDDRELATTLGRGLLGDGTGERHPWTTTTMMGERTA